DGKEQLVRLLAWHVAVDERHDHERKRADVDLGRAEGGALLGDYQVTGERDAQGSGEHVTVRGADHRLPELADQPEKPWELAGPEVPVDERHVRREAGQVRSRGEGRLV